MKVLDNHTHKFERQTTKTVTLWKHEVGDKEPALTGKDKIKMWVCKCGKTLAYELERMLA